MSSSPPAIRAPARFVGHYVAWRRARIRKIVALLGADYFGGKTLLELGCGYGAAGRFFRKLGATVTHADGRPEHTERASRRGGAAIHLNQDGEWDLGQRFDIILHMGVLYHLINWRQDLECALSHGGLMVLETEVLNCGAPREIVVREAGYDQGLYGVSVRASAPSIEKHLAGLGATFVRYDDGDLNSPPHVYDWAVDGSQPEYRPARFRRFWIIRK